MKKEILIISIIFIFVSMFLILLTNEIILLSAKSLNEYENSINYNCTIDDDCEIKDVHNCCGYYPKCVNKDSIVNGSLVIELCKKEGSAGVCGFPSINFCKCENSKCVGSYGDIVGNDSDEHGCKASAGYSWCEGKKKCLRVWEENCSSISNNPVDCEKDEDCPQPNCGIEANCVGVINKCVNGKCIIKNREGKVKILPETASLRARERLGELGFIITLKQVGVGKGNETKSVYVATAEKQGKMFGLFKVKGKVSAEINAETGEVIKTHKPWWSFLASGI